MPDPAIAPPGRLSNLRPSKLRSGGPPQTHTRRPATAETMVNSSPNRLSSPSFALEFLKLDCIGVSRCTAMPNLGLSPLRSRMRPPPFLIRGRRSLPFAPLPFSFEDDAVASEAPAASPRHRYPRRGDAAPFAYPHTRDDRVVSTVKHEKAAKHRRLKEHQTTRTRTIRLPSRQEIQGC
ncbi:hypothetical protein BRADI_4g02521v3 [Brachypodium distachyon]|uniref:Uncharacterized protein n=1 Tax=Brachypodium distachyon TaxID=15368 RepID=A0A0Q3GYJ5_BRADI|nr:hypothetical protein BRADI_4g02521v3 [Brachypodium distachyon]